MEKNRKRQLMWFVIFFIITLIVELILLQISLNLALLWGIGLAIGFVLQRSNFCFAGGFLNFLLFRDTKVIRAIIILIGLSTAGFAAHQYLTFTSWNQVLGNILPWGIYTIIGGTLFGLGMSLSGGCASSSLMRLGEGSVVFFLVVIGFIFGNLTAVDHLEWWYQSFTMPAFFLPKYLGWFKALTLQLGLLFLFYILLKWLEWQKH